MGQLAASEILRRVLAEFEGFFLEADKTSKIDFLRKRPENAGVVSQWILDSMQQFFPEDGQKLIPWFFREAKKLLNEEDPEDPYAIVRQHREDGWNRLWEWLMGTGLTLKDLIDWSKEEKPNLMSLSSADVSEQVYSWREEKAAAQAKVVYDHNGWKAWFAPSKESLCALGTDAWCVARPHQKWYERYETRGGGNFQFYILLDTSSDVKYLAYVVNGRVLEFRDDEDNSVGSTEPAAKVLIEVGHAEGFDGRLGYGLKEFLNNLGITNLYQTSDFGYSVDISNRVDSEWFEDVCSRRGVSGEFQDYVKSLSTQLPSYQSYFVYYLLGSGEVDLGSLEDEWNDALRDASYSSDISGRDIITAWLEEEGFSINEDENMIESEDGRDPSELTVDSLYESDAFMNSKTTLENEVISAALEARRKASEEIRKLFDVHGPTYQAFLVWMQERGMQVAPTTNPNQMPLPYSQEDQETLTPMPERTRWAILRALRLLRASPYATTPSLVQQARDEYDREHLITGWPLREDTWDITKVYPTENISIHPEYQGTAADHYAKSMKEGQPFPPIVIDPNGAIVDGHHRYWAARRAGFDSIPVLVEDHSMQVQSRTRSTFYRLPSMYRRFDGETYSYVRSYWSRDLIDQALQSIDPHLLKWKVLTKRGPHKIGVEYDLYVRNRNSPW